MTDAERIAQAIHEAYDRIAPDAGPDHEALTALVVDELLDRGVIHVRSHVESTASWDDGVW